MKSLPWMKSCGGSVREELEVIEVDGEAEAGEDGGVRDDDDQHLQARGHPDLQY